MNGRVGLLSLIAAVLLGLLLLDRSLGTGPVDPTQEPAGTVAAKEDGSVPLAEVLPEALALHPLFQPSRQSASAELSAVVVPEVAPETGADTVAVVATEPEVQPVLLGVVIDPAPGGAFLGDTAGGPIDYLEPSEESRGLHLISVASDRAKFLGPDGEVTLLLPTALELGGQ